MNASELKYHVETTRHDSKFFCRENMKFAGDTMRNYGVRSATITDHSGNTIVCWELYRRRPVKHGLRSSAYFCKETFRQVFKAD